MGNLTGKTALVTGAAMGNGLGISRVLAQKGALVVMTDKSEGVFAAAAALTEGEGLKTAAYQMDVTDFNRVSAVVEQAEVEQGPIHILVNNAGVSLLTDIRDMDEELKKLHFSVNVDGAWNCVKALLPKMMERRYGRLIHLSSVTGPVVCDPANIAYATTKAAILGFSKAIAIDAAAYHITSNAILPGYFMTPMVQFTAAETDPENPQRVLDEIANSVPVKRLGQPEEIGYLAAFLASDEAAYITGTEIRIDGGSTLPETSCVGR